MPQPDTTPAISFTVPLKQDSMQTTEYRTVHVVVVKPKHTSYAEIIITPLLFVFAMATILVFILYKIKPGKKINRLLDIAEKISGTIDTRIEKGEL